MTVTPRKPGPFKTFLQNTARAARTLHIARTKQPQKGYKEALRLLKNHVGTERFNTAYHYALKRRWSYQEIENYINLDIQREKNIEQLRKMGYKYPQLKPLEKNLELMPVFATANPKAIDIFFKVFGVENAAKIAKRDPTHMEFSAEDKIERTEVNPRFLTKEAAHNNRLATFVRALESAVKEYEVDPDTTPRKNKAEAARWLQENLASHDQVTVARAFVYQFWRTK